MTTLIIARLVLVGLGVYLVVSTLRTRNAYVEKGKNAER